MANIRGSYELVIEPMKFENTNSEVIFQIASEPRILPMYIVVPVTIFFCFLVLCIAPLKFALATNCCKKKVEIDIFKTNPD